MRVAGLFAGIGGIELGFHAAGHETVFLCELDESAGKVLRARFPDVERFVDDVRDVEDLTGADLVAAGFPCQDLSQAGRTAGITGEQSGLVGEVLRLVADPDTSPRWLVLENVPFMLQLERGRAMHFLTRKLSEAGFRWAYRVVDTRSFGLPQRRQRVLLLASREEDPRPVLFGEDAGEPVEQLPSPDVPCGFYWTEGVRGLGLAVDAVPTLKGGSTVGIPSPPAIWMPGGEIVLPEIRDAERLQGFPADWTLPAQPLGGRNGPRWKLVGNAVSVPVARWLGERLRVPNAVWDPARDQRLDGEHRWPRAAWGGDGDVRRADVSVWPRHDPRPSLSDFLNYPTTPLSVRATAGFLERAKRSRLRFPEGFIDDLENHLARAQQAA